MYVASLNGYPAPLLKGTFCQASQAPKIANGAFDNLEKMKQRVADPPPAAEGKVKTQEDEADYTMNFLCYKGFHGYSLGLRISMGNISCHVPCIQPILSSASSLKMKTKLTAFMESMLQKAGKIRSLVRDLKENYSKSSAMAG